MSWQLASFLIVLGTLAIAFWWYERSQPSAKLLAVIGTLAALAALGRDAFAAIPDVKPITTIVLVAGIAFGAGPGFAIGAISGLASNILLGQGPWTPWQMLGWGTVAAFGAGLGALGGRRLPPLALALACAVGAELFNLVLDVYTWTGTGNHSLAGFGVVLGSALVFDLTHVVASFGFGLAFGSVLLRMLVRVGARLQVRWVADGDAAPPVPTRTRNSSPALALASAAALLALGLLAFGLAHRDSGGGASSLRPARAVRHATGAPAARVATARAIAYLEAAQGADGGFGGAKGQSSSELYSAWVAIGLAAAGRDPLSISREGHTVLDAIRAQASSVSGAGDLERTILALYSCGVSVRSLPGGGAGGDPVSRLARLRVADGSFSHLSNLTAFGVFALRAAGYRASSAPIRQAAAWLSRQQDPDGGFGFGTRGGISDVDDTGAVLQALRDAGVHGGRVRARALVYLRRSQNLDGGFGQERGAVSNAQSTAWAVQGLIAAGEKVETVRRNGSRSPLGYLEGLVAPDGSVRYSATGAQTPVWVTAQALTALAGKTLPIAAPGAGARCVAIKRGLLPCLWMSEHAYPARQVRAGSAATERLDLETPERPHRSGPGVPLAIALACVLAGAVTWLVAELVPAAHVHDALALHDFTQLDKPRVDRVGSFLVHLLNPDLFILWGVALVAFAIAREQPRVAVAVVAVMALAPLTAETLKPLLAHPHVRVGDVQIGAASWPSGHATAALALVLSAVLVAPARLRPAVTVLGAGFTIAIGFFLLVLAWHMPSDVIGGYLVATLWMALAVAGLRVAERRWPTGNAL